MPKDNLFNLELYRKIKSMDRIEMERTLNNIYDMGAKEALANAVINLDMEKLRNELGTVSGIGEKRLEQIMEIIQRNIAEGDNKKCKNSN
jgi:ERCC4-type nuclease